MLVNVISESQWFPTLWGGTHTAYLSYLQVMRTQDVKITINSFANKANITHIHTYHIFALFKLLTSKHTVVTTHMMPETLVGTFKGEKYWLGLLKAYLRFFYNHADLIVALTASVERDLRNLGVKSKVVIIPNAINSERFKKDVALREQGRKAYGIADDAFVVMGSGHFIKRKGIDDFIQLAKDFPELTFLWVGGTTSGVIGTEDERQKDMPKNFILTGNVTYDKMPMFYNVADVFCFPSYQETFGMGVVEAADCDVPAVLRDLEVYTYPFKDNYIACSDISDFNNAIKKLSTDKGFYKERLEKCKILRDNFTLEVIGRKLISEYKKLLTEDGKKGQEHS